MPSPVEQIELPELDNRHRLETSGISGSRTSQAAKYAAATIRCRERQLLEAINQLSALREASEKLIAEEQSRWQDAIYKLLVKECGDSIDGGGCDSGEPMDFTLSEISQGISCLRESKTELERSAQDVVTWFDVQRPDLIGPKIGRLRSLLPKIDWRDAITVVPLPPQPASAGKDK